MLYLFLLFVTILIFLHLYMTHSCSQNESGSITVSSFGEISIPLELHPKLVEVYFVDEEKHKHPCNHHHHHDTLNWEIKHFGRPALFIEWNVYETRTIKWKVAT